MKQFLLVLIAVTMVGCAGANGLPGSKGADGLNGTQGEAGEDGTDGANGTDGEDGTDGVNGQNGQDGKDGVGCTVKQEKYGAVITCGNTKAVILHGRGWNNCQVEERCYESKKHGGKHCKKVRRCDYSVEASE